MRYILGDDQARFTFKREPTLRLPFLHTLKHKGLVPKPAILLERAVLADITITEAPPENVG